MADESQKESKLARFARNLENFTKTIPEERCTTASTAFWKCQIPTLLDYPSSATI